MSLLKFDFEWLDIPGRTDPGLAASMARLVIRVGDNVITQVYDKRAQSVRMGIITPLLPIAEWIASNWWALAEECASDARPPLEIDVRHSLVSAEEGFALPSLRLVSEGDLTRVQWRPRRTRFATIDFWPEGVEWLPTVEVLEVLATFVEAVEARLDQRGVTDHLLHELRKSIRETSPEEEPFCRLAGRLGLDPYAIDDDQYRKLTSLACQVKAPLLDDFVRSISPEQIDDSLKWLLRGIESLATTPPSQVGEFIPQLRFQSEVNSRPWSFGYKLADEYRKATSQPDNEPFDLDPVFSNTQSVVIAPTNPNGLDAVVRLEPKQLPTIYSSKAGSTSKRFLQARGLFASCVGTEPGLRLLTSAHTAWQQQSRAFAAELLAPREFLRGRIRNRVVSRDEIDELAETLKISSLVVERQLVNHKIASVESSSEFD